MTKKARFVSEICLGFDLD
uniref:Uncharacterized protein n=1 Tax=Arundo donax TaxID=35708 RepID=A0A0A9AYB1_ARUDO